MDYDEIGQVISAEQMATEHLKHFVLLPPHHRLTITNLRWILQKSKPLLTVNSDEVSSVFRVLKSSIRDVIAERRYS